MPILNASLDSLLRQNTQQLATLWKLERVDGTIFYFTDHNSDLVFESNTYTPIGGFEASARQSLQGLKEDNINFVGVLSSSAITHADLVAGLYRDAKITESVVNWKYPWVGTFVQNIFWISDLSFDVDRWQAEVSGLSVWLRQPVGNVYGRTCPHVLGDAKCTVNLAALTETMEITSVGTQRRIFDATGTAVDRATGYFDGGTVSWTSGPNNGLVGEIKTHTRLSATDVRIELQLLTPYSFVTSPTDDFDLAPGCDKLTETCSVKFTNLPNFGGFPFIPGNDQLFLTPNSGGGIS